MKYISTRGEAPILSFEDVLLAGLARDGGLYVPEEWPIFSRDDIAALAGLSYSETAFRVMRPYVGEDVCEGDFREIIEETYAGFSHPAVAPLIQLDTNHWVLELFHGPTLAFKDFAMQILARLMDRALGLRGMRATIVGATSGDTGGAAVEAFRGRDSIDVFILHPHGRVSDAQRRQMTTAVEDNVHNIALRGTFDDCQALVKQLFNDLEFRDRLALAGVNSINWARIMAQIVYYFSAACSLGAPFRAVNFTVPTGNFGDIFAGYVAHRMGLPVECLVIATNVNDILVRSLTTGRYEPSGVVATQSPSMDIQVSSNFERLLFELSARDSGKVQALMAQLSDRGFFEVSEETLSGLRSLFSAERIDEAETERVIRQIFETTGYVADPHTAVGIGAAWKTETDRPAPMVSLATAHPAKFPDVVERQTGSSPEWPSRLSHQLTAPERYDILDNDGSVVAAYISERSRASKEQIL